MSDESLIRQIKKGNKDAMQHLIEKYYDEIYVYCYHHLQDRDTAQDLTQDTFYHMYSQIEGYQHCGKFLNYLYVIAGNLCRDYYKKHKPIYIAEVPEEQEEKRIAGLENKIMLKQELNHLSIELKDVIILRYIHNLKIHDIAKIQGVSNSLIRYRIKKALEQLRLQMEGDDNSEET